MKKYLALLILLIIGWFGYYLTTTAGLVWVIGRLEKIIPGQLAIRHVTGKLFSTFTLQDVSYQNKEKRTTFEAITVHWRPLQIVIRKAHLNIEHGPSADIEGSLKNEWNVKWKIHIPQNNLSFSGLITGSFKTPIVTFHPIYIAALGITLRHHQLLPTFIHKQLIFSGDFTSGKGKAHYQGTLSFPLSLTMTLRGQRLQLVNLPEYNIVASPDVGLQLSPAQLSLTGKVNITHADITPTNLDLNDGLPEEVVFVGEKQPTTPYRTTILKIALHLSDKIYIHYKELQTYLRGDLVISKQAGGPPIATGMLYTVQGKYSAYGKILDIENGRIIYTGNALTNPGLNIQATRKIRAVLTNNVNHSFLDDTPLQSTYGGTQSLTVGIQIVGTAKNPKITLFSHPGGLNQADILSYLLLGYPQSEVRGGNLLSLLYSANTKATPKLNHIMSSLENTFGLTDLKVEPIQTFNPTSQSVSSTTSVSVGKQILPNLYLHYSVGVFDPIAILSLRYKLTQHWSINSESSTQDHGADVIYEIETK